MCVCMSEFACVRRRDRQREQIRPNGFNLQPFSVIIEDRSVIMTDEQRIIQSTVFVSEGF